MILEDNLKIARLIDVYGKLLTEKQYQIMTSYYFDNLTLSEIADNFSISRQAVNDCLSQATKILKTYEEKLQFVERFDILKDKFAGWKECTKDNLTDYIDEILDMLV